MSKLIAAIFLVLTISCTSQTQLPMASFTVTANSADDASTVWNAVRASLLTNGFSFLGNDGENTKNFALTADQDARVIISKNVAKGFVEIVFFHYRKPRFGAEEEQAFSRLKAAVKENVGDHNVLDNIPFHRN